MKRFLIILLLPLLITNVSFADEPVYLLSDFTLCVAKMKSGTPIRDRFNYNCTTQQVEFINEDNELMKMEGMTNIDTLWLGQYRLIPYQGHMISLKKRFGKNALYVDYKVKKIKQGAVGAYGITTQNGVQQLDRRSYDRIATGGGFITGRSETPYVSIDSDTHDINVYGYITNNSYVIEIDGKKKAFKNRKTLEKIFPEKVALINEYFENNHINFSNTDEIETLITTILK